MLSPVTLGDLFQVTATATTPGSRTTPLVRTYQADPPADLGTYPADLRGARVAIDGLRSLVPGAREVTEPIARTILSSGARTLDADGRDAMLGSAERSITAVTDEIVVAPEQVVTLTSSSGEVPLNLENRLPYDATVRIVLTSAKLDFPEGSVIERTLPAAQTTTIKLPVEIRASGAFPLTVDITSADGIPAGRHHHLHRALHRHLRHRPDPLRGRRAVPAGVVGAALPHLPPGPQAGGLEPPGPLGRRAGWLRSARQRPRPAPANPSPPDPDPLEGR